MSDAGAPVPDGAGTIELPAAATALEHLRLVWAVRLRAGSSRRAMLLLAGFGAAFLAFAFMADPAIAVLWCAPVVLVAVGSTVSSISQWRAWGGPHRAVSIRPGGIDVVTASVRMSVPAGRLARWSVSGPAFFAAVTSPPQSVYADIRRYGALPESSVAGLLAMEPYPMPADEHVIGHWLTTPESHRRATGAARRLRPALRWRRMTSWVLTVGLIVMVVLLALALHEILDQGWSAASDAIAANGVAAVGRVVVTVVAVVVVVSFLGAAFAQAQLPRLPVWLAVDADGLVLAGHDGSRSRIPWASIDTFRVGDQWIDVITGHPWVGTAIPVPALVPGAREWLEGAMASRGATLAPWPVPSAPTDGDRPMGERT